MTVDECLQRIDALEADIHAWVQVAPQPATGAGPLDGVPFGVKDIIETRGLATEYGSEIYRGRIGTEDAGIVRELRDRGAILLGKTQTTAFAYRTPPPTRNPRNLAHTPGGSSSGSAAAVAAGMVPFALGTQTQGSVLRPASYCGVTGFKPTYGLLPVEGVLPFAPTLDTLGLFTPTAEDMLRLWDAMGHATGREEAIVFGAPDPAPRVDPEMQAAFSRAVDTLRAGGATVVSLDIGGLLETLFEATTRVMTYEGARVHQQRYAEYGDRIGPPLVDIVRSGMAIADADYRAARRTIDDGRIEMQRRFADAPVILVPAATGPAPRGLEWTGDARMNSPWTALGTPAISIPMPVDGLPLGLQLVADVGHDGRVLRAAVHAAGLLAATRSS
jgi:Asp-tRNA(Asn)/Glu-tRNA(Gln) amidotransferase A subunit family amidase